MSEGPERLEDIPPEASDSVLAPPVDFGATATSGSAEPWTRPCAE